MMIVCNADDINDYDNDDQWWYNDKVMAVQVIMIRIMLPDDDDDVDDDFGGDDSCSDVDHDVKFCKFGKLLLAYIYALFNLAQWALEKVPAQRPLVPKFAFFGWAHSSKLHE